MAFLLGQGPTHKCCRNEHDRSRLRHFQSDLHDMLLLTAVCSHQPFSSGNFSSGTRTFGGRGIVW